MFFLLKPLLFVVSLNYSNCFLKTVPNLNNFFKTKHLVFYFIVIKLYGVQFCKKFRIYCRILIKHPKQS